MDWTDITISIPSQDLETAVAIAQMVVSRGIYIEDYSDFDSQIQQFGPIEIIDESLLKQDRTRAKLHIYFNPEENPAEARYLKEHLQSRISLMKSILIRGGLDQQPKSILNPAP